MIAFLIKCGLTRDSLVLLWSKVASLAVLITTGALDPAQLGLSEKQKHIVMVIAGVIAYIAGQLSTSALPGKPDPNTVNVSKLSTGA